MPESAIPAYIHQPNPPILRTFATAHTAARKSQGQGSPFREGSATVGSHRARFSSNKQELAAQHRQLTEQDSTHSGWRLEHLGFELAEQRAAGSDPIMLQPISEAASTILTSRDDSS